MISSSSRKKAIFETNTFDFIHVLVIYCLDKIFIHTTVDQLCKLWHWKGRFDLPFYPLIWPTMQCSYGMLLVSQSQLWFKNHLCIIIFCIERMQYLEKIPICWGVLRFWGPFYPKQVLGTCPKFCILAERTNTGFFALNKTFLYIYSQNGA